MAHWTPRTDEFKVNTFTGAQQSPAVAALPSGGYLIVWSSVTPGNDILLQRYNAEGEKDGGLIGVNNVSMNWQLHPTVAVLESGGFVVAWSDTSAVPPDGSEWAVRAQLFDADGVKVGGNFLVNTTVANAQWYPTATALAGGGFVISWADRSSPGWNTKAQIFDSGGNRSGGEFVVTNKLYEAATDGGATTASLAPLPSGGFAAVWAGIENLPTTPNQPEDPRFYITFQRFGPTGAKDGAEVRLVAASSENVFQPKIAALDDGNLIVTWTRLLQDGSARDVRGQVFDASGQPVGAAFTVNTVTDGNQIQHEVSALRDGGFVVTWADNSGQGGDSSSYGIKGQMFDALGAKIGPEFLVNSDTASIQQLPAVATLATKEVLIAWQDHNQDRGPGFEDYDIKARIFTGTLTDLTFHGTPGDDQFTGESGDDRFLFGPGTFAASDRVDGDGGTDRLVLTGPYGGGVALQAQTLTNVEFVELGSAAAGAYNSYNLTMHDGNVAEDATLTVDGSNLRFGEALMFYGHAETDGSFVINGGASNDYIFGSQNGDTIRGGLRGDVLRGNGGNDTFIVNGIDEIRGDNIDGGAGLGDRLILTGDMSSGALAGVTMTAVEWIVLNSAGPGAYYSYNLTVTDAMVAAGGSLLVDGTALRSGETLMFYGTGEASGSLTVRGGASSDYIFGGQGDDTLQGGAARDILRGQGGNDSFLASGLANIRDDDIIGGAGYDTLFLFGEMGSGALVGVTMTEVEEIRFGSVGPGGGGFGYNVTTTDAMVAAGQTMAINGSNLVFNDRLMFYGSAETDGSFAIVGGAGTDYLFGSQNADTIRGGQGADYIQGNGGADILVYLGAGDSQNNFFDIIVGFDRSMDRFDLPLAVTGFGGEVNQGRLSNATFGSDMAAALNGVLGVGQAALFNPDSGDFAGRHFLVVDDNGIAGYQAGGDLVFEMVNPTAPLGGAMDYFV